MVVWPLLLLITGLLMAMALCGTPLNKVNMILVQQKKVS